MLLGQFSKWFLRSRPIVSVSIGIMAALVLVGVVVAVRQVLGCDVNVVTGEVAKIEEVERAAVGMSYHVCGRAAPAGQNLWTFIS